jgi:hypothetical protein
MAQKEGGGMGIGEILILGVGAYLLYNWLFAPAAAASTTATGTTTTGTTSPPVTTTTSPPSTTSPPAITTTPPPASGGASWSIVGAVTPNINNSLTANVNVSGTITNVSIIYPAMTAWNTAGQNVTAQLTALGVNIPALANAMLAAYNAANPGNTFVSGLSGFAFSPWGGAHGFGQAHRVRPVAGRNYVPRGSKMRRIS